MKKLYVLSAVVLATFCMIGMVRSYRVERYRRDYPPDQFTVVLSARPYAHFPLIPMSMPGQGSDGPGYLEIFDPHGKSCGGVPLEMIQIGWDFQWETNKASIPLVAEWDFVKQTCFYWSRDGNRQIWVKQ